MKVMMVWDEIYDRDVCFVVVHPAETFNIFEARLCSMCFCFIISLN